MTLHNALIERLQKSAPLIAQLDPEYGGIVAGLICEAAEALRAAQPDGEVGEIRDKLLRQRKAAVQGRMPDDDVRYEYVNPDGPEAADHLTRLAAERDAAFKRRLEEAAERPNVLDACCGSRMFWFDKSDRRALFVDKRAEILLDSGGRAVVISPDIVGDFTALPFEDERFSLVVFDPPHTFNGKDSDMAKKYGRLMPGWKDEIAKGFAECFRVLCPGGTLVFKWNEHRVSMKTILSLTPEEPLFGQNTKGKTHWVVFMKDTQAIRARGEG